MIFEKIEHIPEYDVLQVLDHLLRAVNQEVVLMGGPLDGQAVIVKDSTSEIRVKHHNSWTRGVYERAAGWTFRYETEPRP